MIGIIVFAVAVGVVVYCCCCRNRPGRSGGVVYSRFSISLHFSGGRVAGVVIGIIVFAVAVGAVVYCCCCRNRPGRSGGVVYSPPKEQKTNGILVITY